MAWITVERWRGVAKGGVAKSFPGAPSSGWLPQLGGFHEGNEERWLMRVRVLLEWE